MTQFRRRCAEQEGELMRYSARFFGGSICAAVTVLLLGSSAFGRAPLLGHRGFTHGLSAEPAIVAPTSGHWQILRGANHIVRGTLFNRLSQGASYGDDAQMSTNYPLVRTTNASTGHVCYARTHDHSRMGISTGGPTYTKFDVPLSCTAGQSDLEVVANGIASVPARIQVN